MMRLTNPFASEHQLGASELVLPDVIVPQDNVLVGAVELVNIYAEEVVEEGLAWLWDFAHLR